MAKREENKSNLPKMYLGPTFYGIIQSGMVISGGIPPKMAGLMEQYPFLGGLMIPVDRLAEARKELKAKGSVMEVLYKRAVEIGGVKDV